MQTSSYMSQNIEVTFLIPCLNEEESLAHVLDEIQSMSWYDNKTMEIVVADNGSTDQSLLIAKSKNVRVVHVDLKGYGAALLGGINDARGEIVVMGDADGSYKFSESFQMVQKIRDGVDLVMGNRFEGGIAPGAMPFLHRYLGNPVLSLIGRIFYRLSIRDFHCGLRGFRKESIKNLRLDCCGMEFASEMLIKSSFNGLSIGEVPVSLSKDLRSRAPHLRTWSDGFRHLKLLLKFAPSWLFGPIIFFNFVLLSLTIILGLLGPTRVASKELSVRSLFVSVAISLVLLVSLCGLEIAKLSIRGGWSSSFFVRFRKHVFRVATLGITFNSIVVYRQTRNWLIGGSDPATELEPIMWFSVSAFLIAASLIVMIFTLIINLIKE